MGTLGAKREPYGGYKQQQPDHYNYTTDDQRWDPPIVGNFKMACNTELIQIVIRDGVKEVSAQMLYKVLSQITDRRKEKRKRDEAGVVLTILLLAKMSGEGGMSGMVQWARLRKAWLQSHLPLGRVMGQGYVTGC